MANAFERSPHRTGDDHTLPGVVGPSTAMREVARITHQVAPSRACVLIVGETGTGKELIARAVHDLSPRYSGPYIRVNCGALTESLLESELFGHVKGSFTGAVDNRTGRFEAAHTGSIFLDEINSTTPKLQVKLLRVLQEGEFERVGDIRTVKVDTRIIAATNRDLLDEIDAGRFREDLYYRLNVVPIHVAPLRERREDIPLLVRHFLDTLSERDGMTPRDVAGDALDALARLEWPGNVRELRNAAERLLILASGPQITLADVERLAGRRAAEPGGLGVLADVSTFEEFKHAAERAYLLHKLRQYDWNVSETARALAMPRSNLYKKIERYRLVRAGD